MNENVKCYQGNYDGVRRGLIIANSKKVAAKIANDSVYSFSKFWHAGAWPEQRLEPYKLYTKPMGSYDNEGWVEGRCELGLKWP